MKNKLVQGLGVYEKGKYQSKIGKIRTKEYELWRSVLIRANCKTYHSRFPTYKDCTVSENFKNFQFFAEWCNQQIGFGLKGYHLDKDILGGDSKVYSEDTCVFIPQELNLLLTKNKNNESDLPVGVCWDKIRKTYISRCCIDSKLKSLGCYATVEEALQSYREVKEKHVKQKAEQYKDFIDIRAYDYFINWRVDS